MSTNITSRMSKEIAEEVGKLLGRGRTTFECPLTKMERMEFWNGMIDPEINKAAEVLRRNGYQMTPHENTQGTFQTVLEGKAYSITFYQYDGGEGGLLLDDHTDQIKSGGLVVQAFPKPVEHWPDFMQWVQNTAIIERDFTAATVTLTELLEFCNTIGQLVRAVPTLADYLSKEKRDILRAQKRSSNMPYEWVAFDRSRIDVLEFALAKAHLMPHKPWPNEFRAISCSHARFNK